MISRVVVVCRREVIGADHQIEHSNSVRYVSGGAAGGHPGAEEEEEEHG